MRLVALTAALVAALGAGCSGGDSSPAAHDAAAAAKLTDIQSIDGFRRAFDADAGMPRVVLILAPT